ncbi:2Fe-2S iron-sulfur cluster-binding protein [Sciscionella marina]|uniref:2Fe-2S iron-sulfur cluster-binding protein n=1 Tax=Sciscionella marina TaxID=508770 RepID=UPI00035D20E8|nr:2Fe-2S iron-sulfur cluster-binding protein [Sciscionella marina]
MTANSERLPEGGRIDRTKPLRATVDGIEILGYRGDTVASAMLANGIRTVAPSLYRSRPRGILGAGNEEPNALVRVERRGSSPMLPATTVELTEGLPVHTLSGIGALEPNSEAKDLDTRFAHTDVLVVGGGPTGLAAALAASEGDARVLLLDDQPELGGALLRGTDAELLDWAGGAAELLRARPEVTVVSRCTAFGYYDENYLLAVERGETLDRQRLWKIRAHHVVLATGANERPIVFAGNDLPGVMLADATRAYVNRYAALPGSEAVIATTNDTAYEAALDLAAAGVSVRAIVDSRAEPPEDLAAMACQAGIEVLADCVVAEATGTDSVAAVRIVRFEQPRRTVRTIRADLLAVSGGWSPDVGLFSQSGGKLRWNETLAAFLPEHSRQRQHIAGAARGRYGFARCVADGRFAGVSAAESCGYPAPDSPLRPGISERATRVETEQRPVWIVPAETGKPAEWREHFVDLQRDATVADIARACGAGMRSPEHIKRYTTIGTGSDQGRTSGLTAVGVLAWLRGMGSPGALGTTSFRAPAVPVSFELLAGRDTGKLLDPVRTTPIHPAHRELGAEFENVGQWKRPWYYAREGEGMHEAVLRECAAARTGVAMMDASTLGKIDLIGPDAGEFLNRLYTNGFKKLAIGSARYGVMCGCDGMVFDDGVVLRLSENHYTLTTTTGGAAGVLDWFEEWLQTEWIELDVWATSVTEQWSTVAVVGPRSREVIGAIAPELAVSNAEFPFMTVRETVLGNGIPARIVRVSFSGELAYEVNVANWHGLAAWREIERAGAGFGITPYGTETMHVLRAEKGFPIVGQDTDGTVTPIDLGMDWIVSKRKDFIGKRSLSRPDTARADRKQLVGLLPDEHGTLIPEGSQLIGEHTPVTPEVAPVPMLGHVTSSYHSAALGRTFALALLRSGRERIGQTVRTPVGDRLVSATVTEPIFYDKEGARRDG